MKKQILTLTSYPPRACGIATYSQDLQRALQQKFGGQFNFTVCALENHVSNFLYPPEVVRVLDVTETANFDHLAQDINRNPEIVAVHIQHEFGLFGGQYGAHLLHLLAALQKPAFVTFHTVLPNPDLARLQIVQAICSMAVNTHVMSQHGANLLTRDYQVPSERIVVIPHGTHAVTVEEKSTVKARNGFGDRLLLATFGLLNANKSIETALRALPAIREQFPQVLYLVLGKTHPEVAKRDGEQYRDFLKEEVTRLGIEDNVLFVDKYLELNELLEYLKMTDIYLFTSRDPHQFTSGTFVYALSSGCVLIATRIPHAQECLDDNTGRLIDFENPEQLADTAIELLGNESLMEQMRRNAYPKTRSSIWENVAIATTRMYEPHLPDQQSLAFDLPDVRLDHLRQLTTSTGMIQFADISTPDPASGYTLDDNARAMIAVLKHFGLTKDRTDLPLIQTYLYFIEGCQLESGRWLNYRDIHGRPTEMNDEVNLDDPNGRAVWALGTLIALESALPSWMINRATACLERSFAELEKVESPRSVSFIIKGLYPYYAVSGDPAALRLIGILADRLAACYEANAEEKWCWFEPYLTYANSVLPEAMLMAYQATLRPVYKSIARNSFQFMLSMLFKDDQIRVVSNQGWWHKNGQHGEFGEQPIDVTYTIEALDTFYRVFVDPDHRHKMNLAFSWFSGNNRLNQIIYNPVNGGCCDGLEEHGVNLNQGAESTVCHLIARFTMERRLREEIRQAFRGESAHLVEFEQVTQFVS